MSSGEGLPDRARPLGISILAVLAGIGFVVGIFVTLVAMGGGGVVRGGALAFVVVPSVVVLSGVTAYGLWMLRWWAWPLALLSWIASGVEAFVELPSETFNTSLVVAPLAVVYLLRGDVRSAFGPRVASPGRRFIVVTTVLALVLTALPIGGASAASWSPTVPAEAGTTLVAEIDLARVSRPPAGSGQDEGTFAANECLDRDQRPAGWLDLCWSVVRQPDDDLTGDYYRFEAWGTFASDPTDPGQASGSGVRWMVLRNQLLVPVLDNESLAEPVGVVEGCPREDTGRIPLDKAEPELPCDGRTVGSADLQTHTVTWTCVGCLLVDRRDRAIGMVEDVKVGEGIAPAWRLHADFGN